MDDQNKLNVGVVFGGVSPEHEVSVISALQAAFALDQARFNPIPIYIAKDGRWYSGEVLLNIDRYKDLDALLAEAVPVHLEPAEAGKLNLVGPAKGGLFSSRPQQFSVDVLLLGLHGGEGENGGIQGLCETYNVPFTGSGVMGSSLGMDKVLSKMAARDQQIPVVDFVYFRYSDWAHHEDEWLDRTEAQLQYPVIVKPARLGSSIGIARAADRMELDRAIEEALRYDEKVIIEQAVTDLREINCSVLGDPSEAQASVLEEPVRGGEQAMLTFKDKYMRAGGGKQGAKTAAPASAGMASLDRLIPAPLSEEKTVEIRSLAVKIFQLFECSGVARIDFLMDETTGRVFFNEINTIPGSFSFYLWEPSGVPFQNLVGRLIDIALKNRQRKNAHVRSYETNLLSMHSLKGLKGAKTAR